MAESFSTFTELQITFVEEIGERLAIALASAQSRNQLQQALAITTEQAGDLRQQQKELQSSNEELEEQTQQLQTSEEELKAANEEMEEQTQRLRASEEELRAKQDQLVANNEELKDKNTSLNRQKQRIEQANQDLELSRVEIERKAEELTIASKYKSEFLANMSHELRTPLNSLLLLAQILKENRKGNLTEDDIESVKVIHNSGNELLSLINDILDLSKIEAGQMDLVLETIPIADFLAEIKSAFQHLIDDKGLRLHFEVSQEAPPSIKTDRKRLDQVMKNLLSNAIKFTDTGAVTVSVDPARSDMDLRRSGLHADSSIAIAVQDSGVGIPPEKQKVIFEAFQQADGSTARKYGGTGLGLSISRDLAGLLGGEIQLDSEEGKGATFTLYLPLSLQDVETPEKDTPVLPVNEPKSPLIAVEHIDDDIEETLNHQIKDLLVAEHDASLRKDIITLVGNSDVQSEEAGSGREVLDKLQNKPYDCLIMGLDLEDMTGFSLLQQMASVGADMPPVIVYTDRELSRDEVKELRHHAESIIVKGAMSEERLLDESALFLHRMVCKLPEPKQRMIRNLHEDDAVFAGKRVLIVDDDMRNVFALAKALQDKGMEAVKAEDGIKALAALDREDDFDLVLMDIMMPGMDGYETMKRIREQQQFKDLPIIALTAKAMQEDRNRCLVAGANDYLAKPVDMERLLALLRVWLYR